MAFQRSTFFLGLGIIVLLMLDVLSWFSANQFSHSVSMIQEHQDVLDIERNLALQVSRAERNAGLFMISEDPTHSYRYYQNILVAKATMGELDDHLRFHDSLFQEKLNQMRSGFDDMTKHLDLSINEAQKTKGLQSKTILAKNYQTLSQTIEVILQELMKMENEKIRSELNTREHWIVMTDTISTLGTLADAALFLITFLFLIREIRRRKVSEKKLETSLSESEKINLKLREADRVRLQFLGMAAHDLRAPIRHISLFSELIEAEHSLPENALKYLQYVKSSTKNMNALLEDLLNEAALKQGALKISREKTDVGALASRVVASHANLAKAKNQMIELTVEPGVFVDIDPKRTEQAIENLLNNAIKFSPFGEKILVTIRGAKNAGEISVRDFGPGIPPSEMDKIFLSFYRSKTAPTAGEPSTGLGLSIVKQLIELQGGKIEVESPGIGLGSQFTIKFPLAA